MDTLIQVQDDFAAVVTSATRRWEHSKTGGHSRRLIIGARKAARGRLERLGFTADQIDAALRDAKDMAELEMLCEATEEDA